MVVMGRGFALTRTIAVVGIEAGYQTATVNVEGFEDLQDGVTGNSPVHAHTIISCFLCLFEAVEDAIEKEGVIVEVLLQDTEVTAVEFDPEAFTLQMFQPAGTEYPHQ